MKAKDVDETSVPAGPHGPTVQRMFADIAHRYDFLNHFLSASVDRHWRRLASARLKDLAPSGSSGSYLDLCSGTGDLALEVHRRLHSPVVASDFCHPMLSQARQKIHNAGLESSLRTVEADALALPFLDSSFDGITIAFGLRNLENRLLGLQEMHRVLKPTGALIVLEFSRPVIPVFREAFQFYFKNILPRIGAWVSGENTAYQYLPDSVGKFLTQKELAELIRSVGFQNVGYQNLSGGIAALHWGTKNESYSNS
jgi:demethylmenaquinone methyltransferase / 2-methoxy-6-polyprenyl-1,4-benzoquinol methylase